MKEIRQYQCEHCFAIFQNKESAKRCEDNHQTNGVIDGFTYKPRSSRPDGHPHIVRLKFDDGKVAEYIRKDQ